MSTPTRTAPGFLGLLTLVFITLKLTNTIQWSWWWVFGPLWISVVVFVIIALIAICVGVALEYRNGR